jgi:hypothetical protein
MTPSRQPPAQTKEIYENLQSGQPASRSRFEPAMSPKYKSLVYHPALDKITEQRRNDKREILREDYK